MRRVFSLPDQAIGGKNVERRSGAAPSLGGMES